MSRIYRHDGKARRKGGKLTRGEAGGPCCCGRPKDIVGPCYARGRCSFQTTFGGPYALHVESPHFKFSTKDAAFKISTHTLQGKDVIAPGSTSGGSTLPYWASTAEKWLINFYGYDSGDTKLNSGGTAYKTRILARLWIDISDDDTLEPDFQLELKTYAQGTHPTTGLPTNDVLTVTATQTATIAGNCAGVFRPWPGVVPPYTLTTPETPGVDDAVENDYFYDWNSLDIPADGSGYSPWVEKKFAPVDVAFGKFGLAASSDCNCAGMLGDYSAGKYITFEQEFVPTPDPDDDEDEGTSTWYAMPEDAPASCVVKFSGNKGCACKATASGSASYDIPLPAEVTCTLQIPESDDDERQNPTFYGWAASPMGHVTTYTTSDCSGTGTTSETGPLTGSNQTPGTVVYVFAGGVNGFQVIARGGSKFNDTGNVFSYGTSFTGSPFYFYSTQVCHKPGLRVGNQQACYPHYAGSADTALYGGYAEVIFDNEENDFP